LNVITDLFGTHCATGQVGRNKNNSLKSILVKTN